MNILFKQAQVSQEAYERAINEIKLRYHNDPTDPLVRSVFYFLRQKVWPESAFKKINHLISNEEYLNYVPANVKDGDAMLEGLKANYNKFQNSINSMGDE